MNNMQPPQEQPPRLYGQFLLDGFKNPSERERADNVKGTGRLTVFLDTKKGNLRSFYDEKRILARLNVYERMANQGVRQGRTLNELFHAVGAGFPVNDGMIKSLFKPQDLFMFLDGMYAYEVRPVTAFVDRPPPRYRDPN